MSLSGPICPSCSLQQGPTRFVAMVQSIFGTLWTCPRCNHQMPVVPPRTIASNAIPPGTYSSVDAKTSASKINWDQIKKMLDLYSANDFLRDELTKPLTEPAIWSEEDQKARKRCDELGMPFSFYQGLVTAARSLAGKNLLTASITKDGLLKLSYQGYDVLLKITEIDVVPNDRG